MFTLGNTLTYQLYRGVCDMRKSFDGLCGLVRNELGRRPASGEVFVFLNHRRMLTFTLNLRLDPGVAGSYPEWISYMEMI